MLLRQQSYPRETPSVSPPGAEAIGHHCQLSRYSHLLTETVPALAHDFTSRDTPSPVISRLPKKQHHFTTALLQLPSREAGLPLQLQHSFHQDSQNPKTIDSAKSCKAQVFGPRSRMPEALCTQRVCAHASSGKGLILQEQGGLVLHLASSVTAYLLLLLPSPAKSIYTMRDF